MSKSGAGPGLRGRGRERTALDRLLDEVRVGQSRVLVVRGEAGVGKTALLDYLDERASGCRVVRAAGVESEMEIAFAGLPTAGPRLRAGTPGVERLRAKGFDARRLADGMPEWRLAGLPVAVGEER